MKRHGKVYINIYSIYWILRHDITIKKEENKIIFFVISETTKVLIFRFHFVLKLSIKRFHFGHM